MEPAVSPSALEAQVRSRPLPRHVGIIMDGNGRWAEERGLPRLEGHREGANSVREVTRCARRLGVEALTLYAFSSQNWARPADEVAGLMGLLREYLERERPEILDNDMRLEAIGEVERLREESRQNTGMVLTLALSYGGREELLNAARGLAQAAARGEVNLERLEPQHLERHLWTHGLPPVDLVVRTSGEFRLSNFLLWQAAYAELVFTDLLWPDFRTEAFLRTLSQYQQRERRFGLTSAQVKCEEPPQRAKA